eukprot:gb/GECH01001471.1/.p1 GENE.gb/GECH01001471.1/~~gb/GECH01001471.1/.p1  ORF type:complete len:182 (+),score=20.36 gb/GECH01001471.1/:1-546(+)
MTVSAHRVFNLVQSYTDPTVSPSSYRYPPSSSSSSHSSTPLLTLRQRMDHLAEHWSQHGIHANPKRFPHTALSSVILGASLLMLNLFMFRSSFLFSHYKSRNILLRHDPEVACTRISLVEFTSKKPRQKSEPFWTSQLRFGLKRTGARTRQETLSLGMKVNHIDERLEKVKKEIHQLDSEL